MLERVAGWAAGFTTIGLLAVADRTGMLAALAGARPLTVGEVAERSGAHERYVAEVLAGLAAAEVVEYDADAVTFTLPDEHAAVVADDTSPYSLAGYFDMLPALAAQIPALVEAVPGGGGVPFAAYGERVVSGIDRANSPGTRILLTRRWLAAMPDVVSKLEAGGARIADIGCGSGMAAVTMAAAYPACEVVGIDADDRAIDRARNRQESTGVTNLTFEVADSAALSAEPGFDLVTALDVIHDLADPLATLRAVRVALRPDGVLLMLEPRVAADLSDDVGNEVAALVYGVSALLCLPQSLATGGAGLGAAWGPVRAEELCREAGFAAFQELPVDSPFSSFYRVQ